MTGPDLARTLGALGWSARHLAIRVGCHRNLVSEWMADRVTVPDGVAGWLETMQALHARNPPPDDWRTRSRS